MSPLAQKQTIDPRKLATTANLKANNPQATKPSSLLGYLEQTGQIRTPGAQSVIKPVQEVMKPMSQELPSTNPRTLPNGQPILASTVNPKSKVGTTTNSTGVAKMTAQEFAQKIKEKYPEYKNADDFTLATRFLDKFPQYRDKVETEGLTTSDQRYDSNLFAGVADYYQNDVMGAIKASDNVLVNNPITRSLAGVGAMGAKGLRDITQGGGELLDKGLAKVGLGEKAYKGSTVGENLYDVGQGAVNTLATAYAPVAVTAIGAGIQSLPENAQKAVGEVMGDVGGFISQAPGLKQWRESLPIDRRQEFDNEVAGAAIGLLTGLKGKKNIIKDPKLFLKQNLNPVNIAKNFQENVLNLPSNAIGAVKSIPGQTVKIGDKINQSTKSAKNTIAEGLISSELKNPAMRKQYIAKVGQTPEKTILDAGIKGSLGEQLDQIITKGQQSRKSVRDNLVKIPDTLKSSEGEWITSKIIEGADESMPGMSEILAPLKEMNQRFRDGSASAMDLNDAKTMLGRYEKIYDQFGRVTKTGDEFEKQALGKMYSKVRKEIEDLGEQYGMNLKDANRETMKREGLRGLYDSALSREAGRDMISLSDYVLGGITMAGDPMLGVGLGIGKKILKSPKVSSRIANTLYSKTKNNVSTIGDTSTIDMNVASRVAEQKIGKGLPYKQAQATPINPQGKVMIKNPQSPVPKKSPTVVIEKGTATKPGTTKVNPQAKPAVNKPVTQKVNPKSNIPLANKEKGSIMDGMKTTISDQIKEAKASGKTFEEFIKSKQNPIYHGGKNKIDKFKSGFEGSNEPNPVSREGIFFAKDKNIARTYANDSKSVTKAYLDTDNIYTVDYKGRSALMDSVAGTIRKAKEAGYDVVEIKRWNDGVGGTQYVVVNPKVIKTEAQLKAERDKLSPKSDSSISK